jgi:uncharacterized protein YdhG (YjbR/CyaY superfamily)
MGNQPSDINAYMAAFPEATRTALEAVRHTIRTEAPAAVETISYGIPTFKLQGKNLVHFAGYANHVGFYPTPVAAEAFKNDLSGFKTGKGSVQFPLDKPMPLDLISRMVRFRVAELSGHS